MPLRRSPADGHHGQQARARAVGGRRIKGRRIERSLPSAVGAVLDGLGNGRWREIRNTFDDQVRCMGCMIIMSANWASILMWWAVLHIRPVIPFPVRHSASPTSIFNFLHIFSCSLFPTQANMSRTSQSLWSASGSAIWSALMAVFVVAAATAIFHIPATSASPVPGKLISNQILQFWLFAFPNTFNASLAFWSKSSPPWTWSLLVCDRKGFDGFGRNQNTLFKDNRNGNVCWRKQKCQLSAKIEHVGPNVCSKSPWLGRNG